jgi:hypothetical protein
MFMSSFADVAKARRVAVLLRKQASALLASTLVGEEAQSFDEQAYEAIAIASRV